MPLIAGWKEEANQRTESFGKIIKLLSKYYEKKQASAGVQSKRCSVKFCKIRTQTAKKKKDEEKERHLRLQTIELNRR